MHRITDIIEKVYENRKICLEIFFELAQAFDKAIKAYRMKYNSPNKLKNYEIIHTWNNFKNPARRKVFDDKKSQGRSPTGKHTRASSLFDLH